MAFENCRRFRGPIAGPTGFIAVFCYPASGNKLIQPTGLCTVQLVESTSSVLKTLGRRITTTRSSWKDGRRQRNGRKLPGCGWQVADCPREGRRGDLATTWKNSMIQDTRGFL
ncbi:hypothetical protein KFK09_026889 [Dendrobium nobile]|uniref:Uncharacterized protein n=1 Tax=Dendrobium nobile TaxID=94219 RepID=A0A8T3A948_DENNO|nr:hypothetical protein KFK09_026889 [Dendrobium nobile]